MKRESGSVHIERRLRTARYFGLIAFLALAVLGGNLGCGGRAVRAHPAGKSQHILSVEGGSFDTLPKILHSVKPIYPDLARRAEVEGTVAVRVEVDKTGLVSSARVAQSSAAVLNEAALESAYKYRFSPAKIEGVPVRSSVVIAIRFELDNDR